MQQFYQLRITMNHKFLGEMRGATSRNSYQNLKSSAKKEMLKWLWSHGLLLFWLIFHERGPFQCIWKISVTMIVILRHEANWLMCWKLELCLGQCVAPSIILTPSSKGEYPKNMFQYNLWKLLTLKLNIEQESILL